jgi:hypothetical protein
MTEKIIIERGTDKDLAEKLQNLQFALSIIEQLKGGLAVRHKWEHLKNLIDHLIISIPYFAYPAKKPFALWRGRIDNSVETFNEPKEFSYCPGEKVNSFGRCNRPGKTIFYGGIDIDTVINELNPEIGDRVHIGEASLQTDEKLLLCEVGGIDHMRRFKRSLIGDETAYDLMNKYLQGIANESDEAKARVLLVDAFFADIFSQPQTKDNNYKITSALAEVLLEGANEFGEIAKHGFAYPSVSHRGGVNFAITPQYFDEHFEWSQFLVVDITDNLGYGLYAKKVVQQANQLNESNQILWQPVNKT